MQKEGNKDRGESQINAGLGKGRKGDKLVGDFKMAEVN